MPSAFFCGRSVVKAEKSTRAILSIAGKPLILMEAFLVFGLPLPIPVAVA
jgi:hypothetical protein